MPKLALLTNLDARYLNEVVVAGPAVACLPIEPVCVRLDTRFPVLALPCVWLWAVACFVVCSDLADLGPVPVWWAGWTGKSCRQIVLPWRHGCLPVDEIAKAHRIDVGGLL